jgi:ribosomal protein S12 methylthiotransferase accessory factor YcaO
VDQVALSLAPFKFRSVMSVDGGPVSELKSAKLGVLFQVSAFLLPELKPVWIQKTLIYGASDGSGTHRDELTATYIAISEALERWAFYTTARSERSAHFGFDLDCSTSGMAAFPSLLSLESRRRANLEAIERWAIAAWWEKRIAHQELSSPEHSYKCYRIIHPWRNVEVVLLHQALDGLHCYGFACDHDVKTALRHAHIELSRNAKALQHFVETGSAMDSGDVGDIYEKRLFYFAQGDGFRDFSRRLETPVFGDSDMPRAIVDTEIKGPWSHYARVWRRLYEPMSSHAQSAATDFFLF